MNVPDRECLVTLDLENHRAYLNSGIRSYKFHPRRNHIILLIHVDNVSLCKFRFLAERHFNWKINREVEVGVSSVDDRLIELLKPRFPLGMGRQSEPANVNLTPRFQEIRFCESHTWVNC